MGQLPVFLLSVLSYCLAYCIVETATYEFVTTPHSLALVPHPTLVLTLSLFINGGVVGGYMEDFKNKIARTQTGKHIFCRAQT